MLSKNRTHNLPCLFLCVSIPNTSSLLSMTDCYQWYRDTQSKTVLLFIILPSLSLNLIYYLETFLFLCIVHHNYSSPLFPTFIHLFIHLLNIWGASITFRSQSEPLKGWTLGVRKTQKVASQSRTLPFVSSLSDWMDVVYFYSSWLPESKVNYSAERSHHPEPL